MTQHKPSQNALITVDDLHVHFPVQKSGGILAKTQTLKAVQGISLSVKEGETLGIVGESGCGKSTFARAVLQLIKPTSGRVIWGGQNLAELSKSELQPLRQQMQIIFQDPLASLNPRMTVGKIIEEPLLTFHPEYSSQQRKHMVEEMMEKVGLRQELINRYPHEFSGGQCQRIGIARAMILNPKLIICDEPVSALDVSIQAQIVNLLKKLQRETGVSFIFISHDLSVVRHISHRVAVFYLGHMVELAPREWLYKQPLHPYTQALVSAVPVPDPTVEKTREHIILEGDIPSPFNPPSGCPFRTRCPKATQICAEVMPDFTPATSDEHKVACHHWND